MDLCRYQVEGTGHTAKLPTSTVNHYTRIDLPMDQSIGIICGPGCYGTFVQWCLEYFTDPEFNGPDMPFTDSGSAHIHQGVKILKNEDPYQDFQKKRYTAKTFLVDAKRPNGIAHSHLWLLETQDHNKDFNKEKQILDILFDKKIVVLPTENTLLLTINNIISKMPIDRHPWPIPEDISKWNVKNPNNIDRWIIREWASLNVRNSARSWCGLLHVNELKEFSHIITVDDLFTNFKETLNSMINYIGKKLIQEDKIDIVYEKWRKLQIHYGEDDRVERIVRSVLEATDIGWNDLTLMEEAWIQMLLRDAGYELKCDGLNIFPTNSKQLRELIYAT